MLKKKNINNLNWFKNKDNIIPAIVQNYISGEVLMLGYMNKKALEKTINEKIVTFFSRKKQDLWKKGETSGNYLNLIDVFIDCDKDTILLLVDPKNIVCHKGKNNCFATEGKNFIFSFLNTIENILINRIKSSTNKSYTKKIYQSGIMRIAQKVGEEAIETILAANNKNKKEIINESSDLIYHLIILLIKQKINFKDIIFNLKNRHENY